MGTKSEKTRRALADALVTLLREMPYAKVTVCAVANRAGVDRQTFYYHFDTMDDLVDYACRQVLSSISLDAIVDMPVEAAFRHIVSKVYAGRDILTPLLQGVGRSVLRSILYDDIHGALLFEARAVLEGRGAVVSLDDVEFAVLYVQYASVSIIIEWLLGSVEATEEGMARRLCASFVNQIVGLAYSGAALGDAPEVDYLEKRPAPCDVSV